MKLKVLGAAGEVTGSNYLLEVGSSRILIDCGLHQGKDEEKRNREPFQFTPTSINAVLLTHAHIDHSGRIPLLYKEGFQGQVFATLPTVQLTEVLWKDSAHLMSEEAEWKTRKNARKGLPPVEPLFDEGNVDEAIRFLSPVSYDDVIDIAPGIKARFRDAGHILGSAILELFLNDGNREAKVVFSGDLGPQKPVMGRNPAFIEDADFVVIESTYGDRSHRGNEETRKEFRDVITEALKTRSKVMIPTFVVDRAQRILYELMLMQKEGVMKDHVPIYFDSPMGVKATDIYTEYPSLFSTEVQGHIRSGDTPLCPENLHFVEKAEDSRAINEVNHAVILAGSGMCNGGRIVHHLKHGIWNEKNHLVFVGYQAYGTLGRRIIEGTKTIRMAGEEVAVKAHIHTINGFSAHADREDLLAWASNFRTNPKFLITHGEQRSSISLSENLQSQGFETFIPRVNQEFELYPGREEVSREKIIHVSPLSRDTEINMLLSDISDLAEGLRYRAEDFQNHEELLSLLNSTRLLLETAQARVAQKTEVE